MHSVLAEGKRIPNNLLLVTGVVGSGAILAALVGSTAGFALPLGAVALFVLILIVIQNLQFGLLLLTLRFSTCAL